MKILLVYAHPEPTSFNHAMKNIALATFNKRGIETQLSDLYAMNFDAVANWSDFTTINPSLPKQYGVIQRDACVNDQLRKDIKQEQEKLVWCDAVIFQFPLWWFSVPAILKGWFDRVITPAFAYDKEKWFSTGLLKPRKALLSVTTQSPLSAYQPNGLHGNIEQYLKPIHHTLHFTGITSVEPFIAYGVMSNDENERQKYLLDYQNHLIQHLT